MVISFNGSQYLIEKGSILLQNNDYGVTLLRYTGKRVMFEQIPRDPANVNA